MSRLFIDTPYLIFENHETQNDAALEASREEMAVLRTLAARYAEIAEDPRNAERRRAWSDLNDLRPVRPLLWMNEVCWNEMNVGDELTLRTEGVVCRRIETELRRTLYQWDHMQGDMVVAPVAYSPFILRNTGFGIQVEADVVETEKDREIASRHFHNQLEHDEDLEKIRDPVITVAEGRTEAFRQFYARVFEGILPVQRRGCTGFWFAPWDDIVFYMGAGDALEALLVRPEFMHRLISRLCDAYLSGLEQFERLGLLARNDTNVRIGSGATATRATSSPARASRPRSAPASCGAPPPHRSSARSLPTCTRCSPSNTSGAGSRGSASPTTGAASRCTTRSTAWRPSPTCARSRSAPGPISTLRPNGCEDGTSCP